MKNYIYHLAPSNMVGDTLYPLNKLKTLYPQIYAEKVKKYEGREFVMEHKIPPLNCLWNDVIHLVAVHPKLIKNAFTELGQERKFNYYEIDPFILEPKMTTVFLFTKRTTKEIPDEEFVEYNPDTVGQYSHFPAETKEYFRLKLNEGVNPLLFMRIPHILYKGEIDVSNTEVKNI